MSSLDFPSYLLISLFSTSSSITNSHYSCSFLDVHKALAPPSPHMLSGRFNDHRLLGGLAQDQEAG